MSARPIAPLIGWSCLLGVFALTFEITCRIEDWVRYRTPLLSPFVSQTDLIVADVDGMHGRPDARFQKWVMNRLGMRGPEATFAKPSATIRVVTIGASETFGLYESWGREFPRQLEDSLNASPGADSCSRAPSPRYEVLNAALPGMSLPTAEYDLRHRVRHLAPDVVLLYPTPAQYLDDEPPRAARRAPTPALSAMRPLYPRMLDRLRSQAKQLLPDPVATWLRRRETESYLRDKPAGWRFETLPDDRLQQYESDLRAFVSSVRSMGAIPLLATHANAFMRSRDPDAHLLAVWEKFYPRARGEILVAFDSAARDVTLRVASDSGVNVVDLARSLPRTPGAVFSDFAHFTDLGAAHAATALRSGVLASIRSVRSCVRDRLAQR